MKSTEQVIGELREEKHELDMKRERLRGFITSDSDAWLALTDKQRSLLSAQFESMSAYSTILELRLTDLMDSVEYDT